MNTNNKLMCGLWHANVVASKHNENGECDCLKCFGTHCHNCEAYEKLTDERAAASIVEKSRCQLCQTYQEKTR